MPIIWCLVWFREYVLYAFHYNDTPLWQWSPHAGQYTSPNHKNCSEMAQRTLQVVHCWSGVPVPDITGLHQCLMSTFMVAQRTPTRREVVSVFFLTVAICSHTYEYNSINAELCPVALATVTVKCSEVPITISLFVNAQSSHHYL